MVFGMLGGAMALLEIESLGDCVGENGLLKETLEKAKKAELRNA